MARRKRTGYVIEQLTIEDLEIQGKGVARDNGKVIFVNDALPGETVDVLVIKKKRDYAEAKPIKFHSLSPKRIEPFCSHFGSCGGCRWQSISYEDQLAYKTYFVEQAMRRIGKLDGPEIQPILGCDKTQYYRNKMEFSFSNKRWLTKEQIDSEEELERNALGFHVRGFFDKVLDIEHCHLQSEPSNEIRLTVRAYAMEHGLTFYDIREHHGDLRNLWVRISNLNEVMIVVGFGTNNMEKVEGLMEHLKGAFPDIASLNYLINESANDMIYPHEVICYAGKPYINEELGHINLKIGPKSFYQTNSNQAKHLYDKALEIADIQKDDVVYDLFSGIGSIALYAAKQCKEVYGIEIVPEAIADAEENAKANGIENCHFYVGEVRKVFDEGFLSSTSKPDVIITDPPRAGMHPKVPKALLEIEAPKILYISCNPATQARDLLVLSEKYVVDTIQPVDMFPQTYHIENIVLLKLR